MKTIRTALLLILSLAMLPVFAADDPADAVALVKKGLVYLKSNGNDALIKSINRHDPEFIKGDIYLAIRSIDGTTLAHPNNPKLIGKNLRPLPDADGKLFRNEIIQVAQSKGSGWVDYRYNNPVTHEIEKKSIYLEKSGDIILEAGIYKGK